MKYKNIAPARSYLDKKLKDKTIKIFFDEEKTKTEIARLVRTAREAAGFSQREIALKAANAHLELKCIFDKVA